jgi:hypothetical protein
MTSDGLTFAWCYKKDEAAELARRSNLFPKLVEMLDELLDDQKCTADEPGEITPCRHCNVRLRADALLADIRQSEQERKGAKHDPK